jgi:hypothetical protein
LGRSLAIGEAAAAGTSTLRHLAMLYLWLFLSPKPQLQLWAGQPQMPTRVGSPACNARDNQYAPPPSFEHPAIVFQAPCTLLRGITPMFSGEEQSFILEQNRAVAADRVRNTLFLKSNPSPNRSSNGDAIAYGRAGRPPW